jgi:hypothetical protein
MEFIYGEQKPDLDELVLAHHGVKGMKWGVRRNSSGPGRVARASRFIATGKTDVAIRQHEQALSGKGVIGLAAKLDKWTWGRNGRFEGYHNTRISQLKKSKVRIQQGELVTRTILFGPQYSK